jgi:hypothetical protein
MKRVLFVGVASMILAAAVVHGYRRSADRLFDQAAAFSGNLDSAGLPPDGSPVSTVQQLQAALQRGGQIQLAPGKYNTNVVIKRDDTTLLATDATITAANRSKPVLDIQASGVKIVGGEFVGGLADRSVVRIGTGAATRAEQQPQHVTLDGVYVHPAAETGLRGIDVNGRDVTIQRSRLLGFLYKGRDSQAIWVSNTPGPINILDNELSASGEVIMFGGDRVRIPQAVPSDIVVRGNHCFKPQEWRSAKGSVKNLFELKNARRVLVEGNTFDGNWRDKQDGTGILLTPRNQYGDCSWCGVSDVTFRRNIVRNATQGFSIEILGSDNNHPTQQTTNITIENNYFPDARNGIRVSAGVAGELIIRHNTWPAIAGSLLGFNKTLPDGSKTRLTFTGNVARSGQYGVHHTGTANGIPSLEAATTVVEWKDNVIERSPVRKISWPHGTRMLDPGKLAAQLDADGRFTGQPAGLGH